MLGTSMGLAVNKKMLAAAHACCRIFPQQEVSTGIVTLPAMLFRKWRNFTYVGVGGRKHFKKKIEQYKN